MELRAAGSMARCVRQLSARQAGSALPVPLLHCLLVLARPGPATWPNDKSLLPSKLLTVYPLLLLRGMHLVGVGEASAATVLCSEGGCDAQMFARQLTSSGAPPAARQASCHRKGTDVVYGRQVRWLLAAVALHDTPCHTSCIAGSFTVS